MVFNTTPNGSAGGIWMSGSGIAVDDDGTFYLTTGNGSADLAGGSNYGEAFLKLRRQGNTLQVADWFIPKNYCFLEEQDRDLGSAGVLLVPGHQPGPGRRQGRQGLRRQQDQHGQIRRSHGPAGRRRRPTPPGTDRVVQTLNVATTSNPALAHNHSTPVYWKSQAGEFVYTWAEEDYLIQWKLENGRLTMFKRSAIKAPDDPAGNMRGGSSAYTMPGGTHDPQRERRPDRHRDHLGDHADQPGAPTTRWCRA